MFFFKFFNPFQGSSNRDICINISRVYPYSKLLFHQDRVNPITSICKHYIALFDFGRALFKMNRVYMEFLEHQWLVKEMMDAQRVITCSLINIKFSISATLSQFLGLSGFLIVTWCVYIENTSFSILKFLIEDSSECSALLTVIAKYATSFHMIVILISHVSMFV